MQATPRAGLSKTTAFWLKVHVEEDVPSEELVKEHVKAFSKSAKSMIGVRTSLPTHGFTSSWACRTWDKGRVVYLCRSSCWLVSAYSTLSIWSALRSFQNGLNENRSWIILDNTRGGRICFFSLIRIFAPIFFGTFENVLSRLQQKRKKQPRNRLSWMLTDCLLYKETGVWGCTPHIPRTNKNASTYFTHVRMF